MTGVAVFVCFRTRSPASLGCGCAGARWDGEMKDVVAVKNAP
jgi:hypothetical protein